MTEPELSLSDSQFIVSEREALVRLGEGGGVAPELLILQETSKMLGEVVREGSGARMQRGRRGEKEE